VVPAAAAASLWHSCFPKHLQQHADEQRERSLAGVGGPFHLAAQDRRQSSIR
jgi:hypothetical protein